MRTLSDYYKDFVSDKESFQGEARRPKIRSAKTPWDWNLRLALLGTARLASSRFRSLPLLWFAGQRPEKEKATNVGSEITIPECYDLNVKTLQRLTHVDPQVKPNVTATAASGSCVTYVMEKSWVCLIFRDFNLLYGRWFKVSSTSQHHFLLCDYVSIDVYQTWEHRKPQSLQVITIQQYESSLVLWFLIHWRFVTYVKFNVILSSFLLSSLTAHQRYDYAERSLQYMRENWVSTTSSEEILRFRNATDS